jgi:replicative DNA helicase
VTAPLKSFEQTQSTQLRPRIAAAQSQIEINKKRLANLQSQAASASADESHNIALEAGALAKEIADTKLPTLPRLIASDTTAEKLASLLAEQDGRMAILSAEGDVFEVMAGRYSGGKGAGNFAVYLQGHSGDDLTIDRVQRPTQNVKRPALTMGLAVQPDVIQGLANKKGFRDRGLLGRFLYALPTSFVGRRNIDAPSMPTCVRDAYHRKVLTLLGLPFNLNSHGDREVFKLQMVPAAYSRWVAFANELEPRLAEHGDLGSINDWAGKLAGAVARIAGLLHMAVNADHHGPWNVPISVATMEHAIDIGRYLIDHARAAFAQMGADPMIEQAKYVLSWLRHKGSQEVSRREIFEGTKGRLSKVDNLLGPMSLLVAHGYLRERPGVGHAGPGRKPSPTYDVNPAVHSRDSHNSQNPEPCSHGADSASNANCTHALAPVTGSSSPTPDSATCANSATPMVVRCGNLGPDRGSESTEVPQSDSADAAVDATGEVVPSTVAAATHGAVCSEDLPW